MMICFTIFAGIDAAIIFAGMSFVTMLPAAATQFLPSVTPEMIAASIPIHTLSSITSDLQ